MINESLIFSQVAVDAYLPELSIDISTSLIVLGAIASRDWQPQHHDKKFAQERNGTRDIFVNTNHNASMIEKFVTDWSGPKGRLGKIRFKMLSSVFPDDKLDFSGKVTATHKSSEAIGWVDISILMTVNDVACTQGSVRVALPVSENDNPWDVDTESWNPDF